jgi:uncharacterized phage-associated protein
MNIKKLIQAVNYVLSKNNYQMDYLKLIKLLYIADRECLAKYDFAITDDTYVSMKKGPVLETLYGYIKGKGNNQKEWNTAFSTQKYSLRSKDKGLNIDELCEAEIDILDTVEKTYHNTGQWDLVKKSHSFPEWNEDAAKYNTSIPLSKADILKAVGKNDKEIKELLDNEQAVEKGRQNLLNAI